jgi:hypothetical protein
MSSSSGEE